MKCTIFILRTAFIQLYKLTKANSMRLVMIKTCLTTSHLQYLYLTKLDTKQLYYIFCERMISRLSYTKLSFSCSIHAKNASRSDLDRLENLFLTDSIGCNFFRGVCGQASFSLTLFCITLS